MLRLCFHPRVSLHAHALERDIAVVPRTDALQNISRIALRTKLLVNGKIALAIFAGSSYVSPCWCDTLPTMIIAPATVTVKQAPRKVSRRAHFRSAKRNLLSATQ